jgi:hypothetical protein
VGIHVDRSGYLLSYLLGSSELALAALCLLARALDDARSLRVIVITLITFNATAAMGAAYAFVQGVNRAILLNVVLRAVMIALLLPHGLKRSEGPS